MELSDSSEVFYRDRAKHRTFIAGLSLMNTIVFSPIGGGLNYLPDGANTLIAVVSGIGTVRYGIGAAVDVVRSMRVARSDNLPISD